MNAHLFHHNSLQGSTDCSLEYISQHIHALMDLLNRGIGEIQAQGIVMTAQCIEMSAGHIGHMAFDGLRKEFLCVNSFRQFDPDEQAAFGTGIQCAGGESGKV